MVRYRSRIADHTVALSAARTSCIILLVVLGLVGSTGCYSKVVRAKGPGASQYKVEQSDRDNPYFSDLFREEEPIKKVE